MKVIDTNQKWFQELPQQWVEALEGVEAKALAAMESGLLFFSIDNASWNRDLDMTMTVVTQVGWEFVAPVNEATGHMKLLFKRGNV